MPGQWERKPDKWSWVAGQWIQPPFSNAYWVPGYWQHRGGQFQWESGHWAAADQGLVVALLGGTLAVTPYVVIRAIEEMTNQSVPSPRS